MSRVLPARAATLRECLDILELSGKQIGLLKEIIPRLSHIAIFGVPGLNAPQLKATETAARAFNVEAESMEVRVMNDFGDAMDAARARHVEAGILLSSPLVFVFSRLIGELALAKQLPLISLFGQFPNTVAVWLRSLGLEQYEATFRDNAITSLGRSHHQP
jgi:hypothetical protein